MFAIISKVLKCFEVSYFRQSVFSVTLLLVFLLRFGYGYLYILLLFVIVLVYIYVSLHWFVSKFNDIFQLKNQCNCCGDGSV